MGYHLHYFCFTALAMANYLKTVPNKTQYISQLIISLLLALLSLLTGVVIENNMVKQAPSR